MPRWPASRLLKWYAAHGRTLPWRGTRDPYRIWVSEVMLQQTQVETVRPYYRRWLRRFPTLRALARAPQEDVLAVWEGLGYYARARNLHRAAQIVARDHAGRLPRSLDGLRQLPGVGRYTAAAIASICFGLDAAVLDGNVRRVLARLFDYRRDVQSARGERELWALAQALLPAGRAGDYNQALMDLGALICTPREPDCPRCPLKARCRARRLGVQTERPVRPPPRAVPHRHLAAAVIRKAGRVLLYRRPAGELLGGLWAFPTVDGADEVGRALQREWGLRVQVAGPAQTVRHTYSHFKVTADVFECRWRSGRLPRGRGARWVPIDALARHPMGKVDRTIALRLHRPPARAGGT